MQPIRKLFDRMRPAVEPGGKLHALRSVFDGMETFMLTPRQTAPASGGVHIHDAIDSKRTMIIVVLALMPCLIFGMYNCGYQHWTAAGLAEHPFWACWFYGLLAILPSIITCYVVGLGIEFVVAQWRGEEIQEGFLVTGILIPLICPVTTPVWMLAVAVAFSVIFVKEVFGGTGYNIFNVALVTRAFLFFAYPAQMSGDHVFVSTGQMLGFGPVVPDGFTGATPLGVLATGGHLDTSFWDAFFGLIPGSFGETSVLMIAVGAVILLASGIGSWRIMFSCIAGGVLMGYIAHWCQTPTYPGSALTGVEQLMYGGFAFAAVFMATDPVTACRTNLGKYIYGFMIGVIAILIRVYNNGYPEGAMLAVLLMNAFSSLIDYCVVQVNVRRRLRRLPAAAPTATATTAQS